MNDGFQNDSTEMNGKGENVEMAEEAKQPLEVS
jgi:hypothetical protein